MVELTGLDPIAPASVTDDDLFLIWDTAAASGNAKNVTRAQMLVGMARLLANAGFLVVDATQLNAPLAAINMLTVTTGLTIGATVSKVLTATVALSVPAILAAGTTTLPMTVTGAVVGDVVILSAFALLPAGMVFSGDVTAADTVTVRFFNATAGTIGAAIYSFKAVTVRVA